MKAHAIKFCPMFLLAAILIFPACDDTKSLIEPYRNESRTPHGGSTVPPAVVTNVQVENLAGKVKISYTLPDDTNLLYVKAEYKFGNGELAMFKSSHFTNTVELNGFADTTEQVVTLYSVSRNEVISEPIDVTVKPLEAPFQKVFKTIGVVNAVGGYNLQAFNELRDNIAIIVMRKNNFDEFERDNFKSIFTSTNEIVSRIRNLDTVSQELAIFVTDRWGNHSDTMYTNVKPMYEVKLNPSLFRAYLLPGDAPQVLNGAVFESMWNEQPWGVSYTHQINGGPGPHSLTFDTGVLAQISRFWIRPYAEGNLWYYLGSMRRFEIYGSENPSLNGALDDSWVLLGSYEVVKPSGLPYGTDSAEDQATAAAGFNFEADLNAPKVRYIRIRCLENFAGGTAQAISNISVFAAEL